ncbi:MAG: cytochrome c3 family protein [Anaerolineaceae bacterium]|nr:cytochrome c3 family protein [Anaerolineaceae bacterium]
MKIIKRKNFFILMILTAGLLSIWLAVAPPVAQAATGTYKVTQLDPLDNSTCFMCHSGTDNVMTFTNEDTLSITIEESAYNQSVHSNMNCVSCHTDIEGYPHPSRSMDSKRDYVVSYHDNCKKCHLSEYKEMTDSIHEELRISGDENTPICSDCHKPHEQKIIVEQEGLRSLEKGIWLTQICSSCHGDLHDTYANSVHGDGLIEEKNPDLPTCIDCHSVHNICDPDGSKFRMNSITMCANCHTNPDIMEKYGKSVNVLNTYFVFHDTTVTLVENQNPEEMTNKPTCYDCHGVHNVSDPADIPPVISAFPGQDLYPSIEAEAETTSAANVGVTSALLGLVVGAVGVGTVSLLLKENKEDEIQGRGER